MANSLGMSRRHDHHAGMTQPVNESSSTNTWRGGTALLGWGGLVWLVAFSLFFHSQRLPNNPGITRPELWLILPELLAIHVPGGGEVADGGELSLERYAARSGWRYFPQRFDLMLVAATILAGAISWGSVILRGLKVVTATHAECWALSGGVGLAAWSLFTLACGMAGWLWRPMFIGVLLMGLILSTILWWRDRSRREETATTDAATPWWQRRFFGESLLPLGVIVVVTPFLLAMALGSMLPSTDFDVKEYHLGGPKEFFQNGRISFLPHNVYTSFPFLTEMLSLSAMVIRDDWYRGAMAGKLILMAFAPLSALAVFALARRLVSPSAGWWAVLIHLSTPWIYRISIIAYTEGGLAFYLIAALLAVVALRDSLRDEGARSKLGGAAVVGLLSGSAAACKYPGLVMVTIPIATMAIWFGFRSQHLASNCRVRNAILVAVGVLAAFGPWMVKNLIETRNPVYPLCYSIFGGADWNPELNEKWKEAHAAEVLKLDSLAAVPGDLWKQMVDVAAINDWGSPLLWGFAPLALLATPLRRKTWGVWLFVAWVFLAWWGLTHRIDRFWVPMIPAVAALAGVGAAGVSSALRNAFDTRGWPGWVPATVIGLPVCALAIFNLAFVTSPLSGYNAYLLDDQYFAESPPTTQSIAAIEAVEFAEPPRVLMVGEAEIFDARFDLMYNTVFDQSLFETWFAEPREGVAAEDWNLRPVDEIRAQLAEQGITHLFVNWSEVLRYRQTYGYTDFVAARRFEALVEAGVLQPMELTGDLIAWDDLEPQRQEEILRWSPELRVANGEGFRRWAFYAVNFESD